MPAGEVSAETSTAIVAQFRSRGSESHGTVNDNDGKPKCKPCASFWKPKGCPHGIHCKYCHLCPAGEVERRKKEKINGLKADFDQWKKSQYEMVDIELKRTQKGAALPKKFASENTSTIRTGSSSRGSKHHNKFSEDGRPKCTPCPWFWKPHGCSRGSICSFCHLCPEEEVRERKKQKKYAFSISVNQWRHLQQGSDVNVRMSTKSLVPYSSDERLGGLNQSPACTVAGGDDGWSTGSSSPSNCAHDSLSTSPWWEAGFQVCIKNTFLDILGTSAGRVIHRVKSAPEFSTELIDTGETFRRVYTHACSSHYVPKRYISEDGDEIESDFGGDVSSINSPAASMANIHSAL